MQRGCRPGGKSSDTGTSRSWEHGKQGFPGRNAACAESGGEPGQRTEPLRGETGNSPGRARRLRRSRSGRETQAGSDTWPASSLSLENGSCSRFQEWPASHCLLKHLLPASEEQTGLPWPSLPPAWFGRPNRTRHGAVTAYSPPRRSSLAGTHRSRAGPLYWAKFQQALTVRLKYTVQASPIPDLD